MKCCTVRDRGGDSRFYSKFSSFQWRRRRRCPASFPLLLIRAMGLAMMGGPSSYQDQGLWSFSSILLHQTTHNTRQEFHRRRRGRCLPRRDGGPLSGLGVQDQPPHDPPHGRGPCLVWSIMRYDDAALRAHVEADPRHPAPVCLPRCQHDAGSPGLQS